jgi:hypothetical protein
MQTISNHESREGSAQASRRAKLLPVKALLAACAAVVVLGCLSGCASPRGGSSDFEPGAYNPNTGYPAIGGGVPWHM